jgi:hypothetical protein
MNVEALKFQNFPRELLGVNGIQTIPGDRLNSHYRLSIQDVSMHEDGSFGLRLELGAKVSPDGLALEWEFAHNHDKFLNLQGWVTIPAEIFSPAELAGLLSAAHYYETLEGERPKLWFEATSPGGGGFQFSLKERDISFSKENVTRRLYSFSQVSWKGLELRGSGVSSSSFMEWEDTPAAEVPQDLIAQLYGHQPAAELEPIVAVEAVMVPQRGQVTAAPAARRAARF